MHNILKIIAFVVIPLGTFLYVVLHLPFEQIAVPAMVVGTAAIAVRANNPKKVKYDGNLEVVEADNSLIHRVEILTPPEKLGKQRSINLKVVKVPLELPPESEDS